VVEGEYGSNQYPWFFGLVDVTPPFVLPETPPQFVGGPEKIKLEFDYVRVEPIDLVTSFLPESYDQNGDSYII
jgi:hypothetical protein